MPSTPHIPDHELIAVVGRGSYGEVWLARNILGTLRAIKVVRRAEFRSAKPYEREFAGIQRFEPVSRSHEGLVDILQVGRNDAEGYFYYVMELADDAQAGDVQPPTRTQGERGAADVAAPTAGYVPRTFATELAARHRLPPSACCELFHRLALALSHLHGEGLVHRDIKPANLIFVRGVPKFADIGLVSGADETGSYVGTEGFIPPEGAGSPAADLYSLGKVLYEAATGKDRLEFPTLPDDALSAGQAELLELNAVIVKACARDPEQRHASAKEFADDLAALRQGRSVKARRRAEKRRVLLRRMMIPAAGFVIVLGLSFFPGNPWSGKAPKPAPSPPATNAPAAADLLALARRLRGEAQPAWRTASLDALARAAAVQPSAELRQEAVHALAGADLRPVAWQPPVGGMPLLLDFARDRYVIAADDGVISFRSIRDHTEMWRHDQLAAPVERFFGFSADGHWLALLDRGGHVRFRRCDPGTGAWVWTARKPDGGHAALSSDGAIALFVRPEDQPVLARTDNMNWQQPVKLPGRLVKAAWAPDDHAVAVLTDSPPGLVTLDANGELRSQVSLAETGTTLAWTPDNSAVVVATPKRLWRIVPGNPPSEGPGGAAGVRSLSFDEGGQLLAAVTADHLLVFAQPGGRLLARAATVADRVAFSPTGRQLATYAPGGTRVNQWEFGFGRDVVTVVPALPANGNPVPCKAEGVRFAFPDGGPKLLLPAPAPPTTARQSPDGHLLHVQLADGAVQEWNLTRLRDRLGSFGLGW